MRWSPLVSLFTVLAVTSIFEGVFAAPLDVVLERRVGSSSNKKLTAGSLKTSSSTYRNAALKSNTFTKSGNGITKTTTPKSPPKGKDAGRWYDRSSLSHTDDHISDHILEAQTVAKALNRGGHTTTGYVDSGRVAPIVTAL